MVSPQATHTKSVSFSIRGSAITEHVRKMVLSDDWRGALDTLTGDGCDRELALEILQGKLMIAGDTASDQGTFITTQDPDCEQLAYYLDTFAFQNGGLLRVGKDTFRPAFIINALGPDDFTYAAKKIDPSKADTPEFMRRRAQYYLTTLKEKLHITLPPSISGRKRVDLRDLAQPDHGIIVWRLRDAPEWATVHDDPSAAILDSRQMMYLTELGCETSIHDLEKDPDAYLRHLKRIVRPTDEQLDELYRLEDEISERHLSKYKEVILGRAGEKGTDKWLRLSVFKEKRAQDGVPDSYLDVPRAPFLYWALQPHDPSKMGLCDAWEPVSCSGWRMVNDEPHHTDWIIGAGLDPREFSKSCNDISNSSYALRFELCHRLLAFEFVALSRPDGIALVSGKLRHIEPGETLNEGEIGIIDRASVEYDSALRSAAKHGTALICLTGGPLAHIPVVGREMGVPIIMWDKAAQIARGTQVEIDLKKMKIVLGSTMT